MAAKQKVNKAEAAASQVNNGYATPDAMLRLQDGIQQMFRGYAQVFSALADLTGQPLAGSQPLVGSQSSKEALAAADKQKNNVPAFQSAKSVERPVEQKTEAAEEPVTQPKPEQAGEPVAAENTAAAAAPVQDTEAAQPSVDAQTPETAQTSDTAQTSEAAQTAEDAQAVQSVQPSSEAAEVKTVQISKDDILREIQGKFKKDKKNQERVRNILGAYGIVNLSQLPAEKYADFINDVRQL